MPDDDPDAVGKMITYLYTLDYSPANMRQIIDMYILGDKYGITGLNLTAYAKLTDHLYAMPDVASFVGAVSEIYDASMPEAVGELRELAVDVTLTRLAEFKDKEGFRKFLKDTPDLACDLICTKNPESADEVSQMLSCCPNCNGRTRGKGDQVKCSNCHPAKPADAALFTIALEFSSGQLTAPPSVLIPAGNAVDV